MINKSMTDKKFKKKKLNDNSLLGGKNEIC